MGKRGFTLAETVVVLAIIVIVYAIAQPVVLGARTSAGKAVCQSNLYQMFLSISAYRESCEGSDTPGWSTAMGLPPFFARQFVVGQLGDQAGGAVDLKCKSPRGYPDGSRTPEYFAMWPICEPVVGISGEVVAAEQAEWVAYVSRLGPSSVILVDPNHQPSYPATPLSTQFGMGVTLAGGLRLQSRRGSCLDRAWWREE